MKILLYIFSFLIGIFIWNSLDHIYWSDKKIPQKLQLNINAHKATTPLQLEREIIRPLEYILKNYSEVKSFSSFIEGQYAKVIIQLKPKTDTESFRIQVNEKFRGKWAEWKLTINYPTWHKKMNLNRQKISFAGIGSEGQPISKEEFQEILNQKAPHLSIDEFTPPHNQTLTLNLSKSLLDILQVKLGSIKNQLTYKFQKSPPLIQLLNAKITNPTFLTESLFYLSEKNRSYANPNLWVQSQPAYRIELSYKKTLKQLLRNNSLSLLNLDEKIKLFPINNSLQPSIKLLKWSLYFLLGIPIILLPFRKIELLLLLLLMQFSLFASLLHFSQTITMPQLWLFISAMGWVLFGRLILDKKSIWGGLFFLWGCLHLCNFWVTATPYNLYLFSTVLGTWAILIGIFDWWFNKKQQTQHISSNGKAKYYWLTLFILMCIVGFLWNKNKNNFFEQPEVIPNHQSDASIRLGISFHYSEDPFEFSQHLLTLLKQIQRLPEVRTIILDASIPDGLTTTISLMNGNQQFGSARVRNELEKFMLRHPNQTFVLEGLGKELAQSSAIINRGVHLILKGFHYPELMKQALAIEYNLNNNRRVTQTYLGLTPGPTIESSKKNILVKTSATNKAQVGWMLNQQMPQKITLDLEDSPIHLSTSSASLYQWTTLLQTSFYKDEKLLQNPLDQSLILNYNQPPMIFKKNGIFELVIGFSFLGSKKQAASFLRQQQKEINKILPFGLTLDASNSEKKNAGLKLVGAIIILAGFFYIISQNHLWNGSRIYLIFILTFFIGYWLLVALSSKFSITPFIPLLSYWIFSICQIHGAILFKS